MASIRHVFPLVLTVQLITAVGLTGWLSFSNGERAVNKLASNLSKESSERIQQHINYYLEKSSLVNDSTGYSLSNNIVNPENQNALLKHLWEKIEELNLESHIYYGNESGDFVGVDRYKKDETLARVRNEASAPNRLVYKLNEKGERATLLEPQNYDPRLRDWYIKAKQEGKPTWSPIFTSADRSLLTISRATPIYTSTGKFRGAIGINVTLSQISEFLDNQKIGLSGEAFIMELNGDIVASSTDEPPFVTVGNRQERLAAINSSNLLIKYTALSIRDKFKEFAQVGDNQVFKFDLNGRRQLVNVAKLGRKDGLDWLIVVIIPESDFMEEISDSNRQTIIIIVITLVLSIAIGLLLARWLLGPMERLNKAAKAIEDQEFSDEYLAGLVDRKDEIGQMSRVFQRMGNVVFAREKGMKDQLSQLRQESDRAKKAAMAAKIGQNSDLQNLLTKARSVRGETHT
jgi:HAMP domain-containing protein